MAEDFAEQARKARMAERGTTTPADSGDFAAAAYAHRTKTKRRGEFGLTDLMTGTQVAPLMPQVDENTLDPEAGGVAPQFAPPQSGVMQVLMDAIALPTTAANKVLDEPMGPEMNPLRVGGELARQIGKGVTDVADETMRDAEGVLPESVSQSPIFHGMGDALIYPPNKVPQILGEWAAQEVESAPTTLALGGVGELIHGLGLAKGIGQMVEDVAPGLVFEGGLLPESKAAKAAMRTKQATGGIAAAELGERIVKGGGEKKVGREGEDLIGYLMTQPAMREAIMDMNAEPVDINNLAKMMKAKARAVPSLPETYGPHGNKALTYTAGVVPDYANAEVLKKFEGRIKTFAEISDDAARAFGKTKGEMARALKKDPDLMTRFTELNYAPITYAKERMALMPSVSEGLREKKGFLKFREQMTKDVREQMGQMTTGPSVALRLSQENNLIATRQLFDEYTRIPGVVMPNAGNLTKPVEIVGREAYMRLPNEPAYGSLAGQYVRQAEAKDIKGHIQYFAPQGTWERNMKELWTAWKFGKTVLSPKTHIANTTANVMMAHAAGLSPWRMDIYAEAAKSMKYGNDVWTRELKDVGAPWMSNIGSLMDDIMPASQMRGDGEPMSVKMLMSIPRFMKGNMASKQAAKFYQAEEAFFKRAVYIAKRQEGMTPIEAMQHADAALINYDHVPHWVKMVRSTPGAVPFVTFTYGVTPLIAKAVIERPDVFYHYKMALDAFNNVQRENYQISDKRWDEIQAMFPSSLIVYAGKDANGFDMVHDVARYTPLSGMVPGRNTLVDAGGAVGGMLQGVLTQSPAINEIASQTTGIDLYSGRPFTPVPGVPSATEIANAGQGLGVPPDVVRKMIETTADARSLNNRERLAHLARTLLPDLLGGGTFQNVWSASHGKDDFFGNPVTVAEAIRQGLIGRPQNVTTRKMGHAATLAKVDPSMNKAAEVRGKEANARR